MPLYQFGLIVQSSGLFSRKTTPIRGNFLPLQREISKYIDNMTCSTSYTKDSLNLCPKVRAALHSGLVVGAEGMMIYDILRQTFVEQEIFSKAIKTALEHCHLLQLMESERLLRFLDPNEIDVWQYAENCYDGRLSMNLCLDKQRAFYINLQFTPMYLGEEDIRYIACYLRFSAKTERNILFIDRQHGTMWRYEYARRDFVQEKRIVPSANELEMIRLSRIGYTERIISELMYLSPETIKGYRKNIYKKLDVTSIESAISYCELHHLL